MGDQQTDGSQECKDGHAPSEASCGKIVELHRKDTEMLTPSRDTLLHRIGRLDAILAVMEEKAPTEPCGSPSPGSPQSRHHSSAPTTPFALDKRRKPTESVLEEVQEKGTLVERVSDLEKRVAELRRMFSKKSAEDIAHPSTSSLLISSQHQVHSHHEYVLQTTAQDSIDVEKHEVILSNAPIVHDGHLVEHFGHLGSHDINGTTTLKDLCVENYEGMIPSQKASSMTQEHDGENPLQKSKKRSLRNWLKKHLHIHFRRASQDECNNSSGRCWGPQAHPMRCWSGKERTRYAHYGHTSSDEE